MAIILLDALDHHSSAYTDNGKWNNYDNSFGPGFSNGAGTLFSNEAPDSGTAVNGRNYHLTYQTSNRPYGEAGLVGGYKQVIISADCKVNYNYNNTSRRMIQLAPTRSTPPGQGELRADYNVFQVHFGTRQVASKKRFLDPEAWHHLEWEIFFDNVSGWTRVRLNGEIICYADGLDTNSDISARDYVNRVLLSSAGQNARFANVCVIAVDGSQGTQIPLGLHTIETLYPSGTGDLNQFVNSSGDSINNYQYVNSATPNADNNLVSFSDTGLEDLYTIDNLLNSNDIETIHCLEVGSWAHKNSTTLTKINPSYRISGVTYTGADMALYRADYDYFLNYFEQNDATTGAFTVDDINNIQLGNTISN